MRKFFFFVNFNKLISIGNDKLLKLGCWGGWRRMGGDNFSRILVCSFLKFTWRVNHHNSSWWLFRLNEKFYNSSIVKFYKHRTKVKNIEYFPPYFRATVDTNRPERDLSWPSSEGRSVVKVRASIIRWRERVSIIRVGITDSRFRPPNPAPVFFENCDSSVSMLVFVIGRRTVNKSFPLGRQSVTPAIVHPSVQQLHC